MWRGLIAATLIAWSSSAFAQVNFGVTAEEMIGHLKLLAETELRLIKCEQIKNTESQACQFSGEIAKGRISTWTFDVSNDGYLEAVRLDHFVQDKGKMPDFNDPSMERARNFIGIMIVALAQPRHESKSVRPLVSYVQAIVLQKPLPPRPYGIRVEAAFDYSHFAIIMRRSDN